MTHFYRKLLYWGQSFFLVFLFVKGNLHLNIAVEVEYHVNMFSKHKTNKDEKVTKCVILRTEMIIEYFFFISQ